MEIVNRCGLIAINNIRFVEKRIAFSRNMRTQSSFILTAGLMAKGAFAWTARPRSNHIHSNNPIPTHESRHALTTARWMSTMDKTSEGPKYMKFKTGDLVQVEIVSFGPLGATAEVVGVGHSPNDLIGEDDPVLGVGLILQREIHYYREGRRGVDIVKGEVLPAYIEKQRDDDKVDIALRPPGGKAKTMDASKQILEHLSWSRTIALGDKSTPEEISLLFPGISKAAFKKAVSALYKKGLVKPGPNSISKMSTADRTARNTESR
jgi:hypothetical protein